MENTVITNASSVKRPTFLYLTEIDSQFFVNKSDISSFILCNNYSLYRCVHAVLKTSNMFICGEILHWDTGRKITFSSTIKSFLIEGVMNCHGRYCPFP